MFVGGDRTRGIHRVLYLHTHAHTRALTHTLHRERKNSEMYLLAIGSFVFHLRRKKPSDTFVCDLQKSATCSRSNVAPDSAKKRADYCF